MNPRFSGSLQKRPLHSLCRDIYLVELGGFVELGMAALEVLGALANLPRRFVKVDCSPNWTSWCASTGKAPRFSRTRPPFVRIAALHKLERYNEAWGHAARANRAVFSTMRDDLRRSRERENAILGWLRATPIRRSKD